MTRFLKTLTLLTMSLFLVVSGVDAALDHLAHSATQSSFIAYSEKGAVLVAYTGDLNAFKAYAKPGPVVVASLLHRT